MAFFKKFRDAQRPCCAALVAAAGSSSRMGGVNKLLQPLDGIPVLARTLTALQMARRIDEIVVAAREEDFLEISQLCRTYGITKCTKVIRSTILFTTLGMEWLYELLEEYEYITIRSVIFQVVNRIVELLINSSIS